MIFQYAYNISEINNLNDISYLIHFLSDDRKEVIRKYRFDKDKIRSIFAEVLLRYALYERYDLKDENIVFDKTEYGKPFLENNENIFFNLSHSGNWVVCAVGDKPIGIDVELMENIDFSIMEDIFTNEECEYLLSHDLKDRLRIFYNIWTLKESYTKSIGEGLGLSLHSFWFQFDKEDIILYVNGKRNAAYSFYLRNIDQNYAMSVCVADRIDSNNLKESFRFVSLEEIVRWRGVCKC